MEYRTRLVDEQLNTLLAHLPAIALDGPKGVGKTETALRRSTTALRLDTRSIADVAAADPAAALERPTPVLVDEWQRVPEIWDAVRRAVDEGASAGSFLLTGSATPARDETLHSGAGRIASLRMRPMALCERHVHPTTVSLTALLSGDKPHVDGDSTFELSDYADEITRSGFPGLRGLPTNIARAQLDSYITRVISRDLEDHYGVTIPRPESLHGWLRAYAAATSSNTSWETIRRAATPGDGDPPSKTTTIRYRDWLTALWMLDPVPAWLPLGTSFKALAQAPKHHLADPALSARLLRMGAGSLLDGATAPGDASGRSAFGRLFESLATLSVRACAQALDATTSHLRTRRGDREVDLIVEGPDGETVGVEIKLSATVRDDDVRHLHWLADHLGDAVRDLVVINTGPHAYRRPDGIAVVPLALLGL